MKFWKMEACGNDFIMIERQMEKVDYAALARALCPRHTSIGADGLIILSREPLTMTFFNADGSEGAMCGNGLRCFIKLASYLGLAEKDGFTHVKTLAGEMTGRLHPNGLVEENLGQPITSCQALEMKTDQKEWRDKPIAYAGGSAIATCLQVGALHCVVFDKPFSTEHAHSLHASPLFKDRMNVDFVEVENEHEIRVHTYERGVGWTLSCGTGTSASVWCAYQKGLVSGRVTAHEPTGDLFVEICPDGIHLTGPVRFVYEGETA